MATVHVQLPSLLTTLIGSTGFDVEAATLTDALERIADDHGDVARHLFDDRGALREHVLCLHNDTLTRWLDTLDVALADGDRITFLQAVSGG